MIDLNVDNLVSDASMIDMTPRYCPFFTGYRIDLEPREKIIARSAETTNLWHESFKTASWEPPDEIDPREWFDIHNQGAVGSCQGQSLADAAEYGVVIATGKEIQISRAFAYLASQEFGGHIGSDNGSTLSGGSKAAKRGLPAEADFDYVANYRTIYNEYRQRKSEILANPDSLFKLNSEVRIRGFDDAYRYISGWTGSVHIGIDWNVRLRGGWEIHDYSPGGRGGHAILICGYLKMPDWEDGKGLLLKNSHSTQWGRNGWAIVRKRAFDAMMSARSGIGIGRSDAVVPMPRRENADYARAAFGTTA